MVSIQDGMVLRTTSVAVNVDLTLLNMSVTHRVLQSTVMSKNGEAPRNLPGGLAMSYSSII